MRRLFTLLTTLLVLVASAAGQTTVPADSRVRVSLRDGRQVTGKLIDARGDTLVVISDGRIFRPTWTVAANQTARVEVSRGRYRSGGRIIAGALLGAGGALVAARAIPGLVDDGCSGDVCYGPSMTEPIFIGFVAGGLLGALSRVDRWERVPTPVHIGVGGDPNGARLSVSFAF